MTEDKKEVEYSIEQVEGSTQSTDHAHYYEEGVVINGLKEVICSCGHGLQVREDIKVKDGKVIWTK